MAGRVANRIAIETTIALEPELLQKLTQQLESNGRLSLSELIEDLIRGFLAKAGKTAADLRDAEIINQNADRLNREAEDVPTYPP